MQAATPEHSHSDTEKILKEFETLNTRLKNDDVFSEKFKRAVKENNLERAKVLLREGGVSEPQFLRLGGPTGPHPEWTKCFFDKSKWYHFCITVVITVSITNE
jgi:hypothetical protein